jgi:hypothetical protein
VKTISLKKVAVVAVASLGFGLLSVVPAQAAFSSFYVHAKSVSGGLVECAQTLTSSASTTITSGGGVCLSDALTPAGTGIWTDEDGFIGTIVSNTTAGGGTVATIAAASPSQAAAAASWYKGTIATTTVASGIVANAINGMTVSAGAAGAFNIRGDDVFTTDGGAKASIGGQIISSAANTLRITDNGIILPFTAPVAAGTYNVAIQVKDAENYSATDQIMNFTLTVTANPATTYGSTTVTKATGTEDAAGVVYGSASYSGTAAATFTVSQKDLVGNALATANTQAMTVALSGVGSLAGVASGATPSSVYQGYAAGTANAQTVSVFGDGRAGKATITVAVNGATVSTKTVVLYGAVATITPTLNYAIGRSGGYEAGLLTKAGTTNTAVTSGTNDGLQSAGSLTQTAIAVALKDSAGNNVPVVPSSVTSSNAAVLIGGIKTSFIDDGTSDYTAGFGVVHMTYATAATSKSGDTATLTINYQNAGGALITATPLTIKIGGTIATESIAFDKTTYAAGEAMVITRTAKDSAGNPVYDGAAAPAITFSKAVGGTAPAASVYVGGTKSSKTSTGVQTVFAPATSGSFSMNATSGNAAGSALTASATVTDANAGLLTQIDALNAKIVALNALIAKIMKKLGVK